jgi:hypothetical protein
MSKVKITIYDKIGGTTTTTISESELANMGKFGIKYDIVDTIPEAKKPDVLKEK